MTQQAGRFMEWERAAMTNALDAIKNTIRRYDNSESAKRFYYGIGGTPHRTKRLNREYKIVNEFVGDLADKNILALDIGCSGGRYVEALTRNGIRTYGIDTSFVALKFAKTKINEAFFIQANAIHLPFKNECFDLVLCIELLHHFDGSFLEIILDEISRVTKPGGILISDLRNSLNPVMWYSYHKRDGKHFTLKTRTLLKMRKLLREHGFVVLHSKGIFFSIPILAPYVMLFCEKKK